PGGAVAAPKPATGPVAAKTKVVTPAGKPTAAPAATRTATYVAPRPAAAPQATRVAAVGRGSVPTPAMAASSLRSTRYGAVPRPPVPEYAPSPEKLPPPPDDGTPRTLTLHNVNTQETVTATYWRNGRYVQSEIDRLNAALRDSRNGSSVQMDPRLFDVLWHVRRNLGSDSSFEVLSAYRSPETNAWLASTSRGVASDSLHMRGQAIDVKLPGHSAYQIRQAARGLGLGGVGYYARSGFVHLDTGDVRYW
ncbi:MAG: DUF882 domain-containing protein, partial [Rhodospirillales bacterium]|nr:DUF882 domain-containing protein [Rhodospirillales bacterium]